ncbi:MAG TPA: hypothetical protein VGJ75_17080, partial [Dongiaceae bacterium]
ISLHTVSLEHQTGHLVLLEAAGLPVVRHWYVLHRAAKALSPAAAAFKQFMHDEAPGYMKTLLPGAAPHRGSKRGHG